MTDIADLATTLHTSGQDGSYPRPTLVREQWLSLDRHVGFAVDDLDMGVKEQWWDTPDRFDRSIQLPFPPESQASGIGDTSPHRVVWYRIETTPDDLDALGHRRGNRLLLHFEAVDYRSTVWVDGTEVGSHEGGQTPFSFDITNALASTDRHIIVVRALDDPHDLAQPRGKQTWHDEPHSIWYSRSTGIWRPVWMESVPPLHITQLSWDTTNTQTITALVELNHRPQHLTQIHIGLSFNGLPLATTSMSTRNRITRVSFQLPESTQLRWSPEHPRLIDAAVSIGDDQVGSYLGLRTIGTNNTSLTIDGRPVYLRQVLEQCFWPHTLYSAPDAEALRAEAELIGLVGFNGMRIHQQTPDPRLLFHADRLGLLVFGEIGSTQRFTSEAVRRLQREWSEAVVAHRSHPSIVCWVPINESWGFPDIARRPDQARVAAALASLTRALDPTRPALSNDGWQHVDSDIITIHDYDAKPATLRLRYRRRNLERMVRPQELGPAARYIVLGEQQHPNVPVMVDECGGIRYSPGHRIGRHSWGYSVARTRHGFHRKLREIMAAIRSSDSLAGFCWTQFTDTMQEQNGLCDEHRNPKLEPEQYAKIFGPESPE